MRKYKLEWSFEHLFHVILFIKCWKIFPELNSKGLCQNLRKEKEGHCLVSTSSTKREVRHFHVVVVQRRQRNVQKSVSTCKVVVCQSKPIALLPFSLTSPSSSLELPNVPESNGESPEMDCGEVAIETSVLPRRLLPSSVVALTTLDPLKFQLAWNLMLVSLL